MNTRSDDLNTTTTGYGANGNGTGNGATGYPPPGVASSDRGTTSSDFGATGTSSERSTGSLMRELMREVSDMASKEMALARSEMRESLTHAKRDATTMTTGGVVLMGGFFILLIAATALLAEVMEPWLAALIVGGVAALAGYMMLKSGMEKLRQRDLKPNRTVDSFHKHANAVREARNGYH